MSLSSVRGNLAASAAIFSINRATTEAADSSYRLSSNNRLARASDDVAALSVGAGLRAKISAQRAGLENASIGSSMMQVAAGGISQIIDILEQQQALAVSAQSGSLTASDRAVLNQTFQEYADEIDQIASATNFNGVNLLAGGLGSSVALANTNALAAGFDPTSADINTTAPAAVASTVAIQAFNKTDGTLMNNGTAAGQVFVCDSGGTLLANAAYLSASTALYGQFSSFRITDVNYGVSATLTATINGVEFSGTIAHNATTATLGNGGTYLRLGATAMALTNAGTVSVAEGNLTQGYANTVFMRTASVQGVDFSGTRLQDAVGVAAVGIAMVRTASSSVDIRNFRYAGNASAADTNILTVEVNGQTFHANGVTDTIDDGTAARLVFDGGDGQALLIDITGLTAGAVPNTAINDIRTNMADRNAFINALNVGFSRAGGGMSFNMGGGANDTISVALASASTANLYGGQTLDIGTTGTAASAETALDAAITTALSLQAKIGAIQEAFDYAGANLETSILGNEAGRSILLDTNIAEESTNYASLQVQIQAGVAALAQANQIPNYMLKLLQ